MSIDLILTILLGAVLLAALVLVTDDWWTKQFGVRRNYADTP